MEVNFLSVFPTPMGYVNLGEMVRGLNKTLIIETDDARAVDYSKEKTFSKNDCAWQSKGGMEKKYEGFSKLSNLITQLMKPVLVKAGVQPEYAEGLEVSSLWANLVFAPGGYSQPHIHGNGNVLWSGVYYPHGNEEIENLEVFNEEDYIHYGTKKGSGNLILMDPAWAQKRLVRCPSINNPYTGGFIQIVPRESLLVMFPVWLAHMVQPVTDHEKRYSISFNISRQEKKD